MSRTGKRRGSYSEASLGLNEVVAVAFALSKVLVVAFTIDVGKWHAGLQLLWTALLSAFRSFPAWNGTCVYGIFTIHGR